MALDIYRFLDQIYRHMSNGSHFVKPSPLVPTIHFLETPYPSPFWTGDLFLCKHSQNTGIKMMFKLWVFKSTNNSFTSSFDMSLTCMY